MHFADNAVSEMVANFRDSNAKTINQGLDQVATTLEQALRAQHREFQDLLESGITTNMTAGQFFAFVATLNMINDEILGLADCCSVEGEEIELWLQMQHAPENESQRYRIATRLYSAWKDQIFLGGAYSLEQYLESGQWDADNHR